MFRKEDYIHFSSVVKRIVELDDINRRINIDKLKRMSIRQDERIMEFIATNNIEGDVVSTSHAKKIIRSNTQEKLSKTQLEKRWAGIVSASTIIWSDKFSITSEYLHEVNRALHRYTNITGGIYKQKMNQVGTLITLHPEDVPNAMNNLFTDIFTVQHSDGLSMFNIIPFISEFLAIHPYEDGNGRLSRLLFNRMAYDAGFKFTKYVSVSKFIWKNKDLYIKALESRNSAWLSKSLKPSDLIPLFEVLLDAMINAASRAYLISHFVKYNFETFSKWINSNLYKEMSFREIHNNSKSANSISTIKKYLSRLVEEKVVKLIGKHKSSVYKKSNT